MKTQIRTRQCGCPDYVPRDCRFTNDDVCPFGHFPEKRWLWSQGYVDVDTGEVVDIRPEDVLVTSTDIPEQHAEVSTETPS